MNHRGDFMLFRTKLADRVLPNYTKGEEIFNMVSHIVGGVLGVVALLTCIIIAAYHQNTWGVVSGAVYGFALILLFTMSSIYHGLKAGTPKKVFQILDHCTIFILIAGTYTPVLLNKFREAYSFEAWLFFAIIWGLAVFGIVLNSIDLDRFKVFSLICYIGMGWLIVVSFQKLIAVQGKELFILLLFGGIFYSVGAVFYVIGKKKKTKYIHSVFHIFVVIAALMHFLGIAIFVMPV